MNRISAERITEARKESRNQKLELFLKIFQDIVWNNEYSEDTIKKARQRFVALSRAQAFSLLATQPKLQYYRETEAAFFQHILAGHSKANFFFLFNHAYNKAMERLEQKRQERGLPEWEQLRFDDMSRFLRTQNEKKRANILIKMADYEMISPYSQQEVDLQVMFGSHLAHKAFGILLRIPYLQIIRGRLEKG